MPSPAVEIKAKYVDAGADEPRDHVFRVAGRAYGGDDLGASEYLGCHFCFHVRARAPSAMRGGAGIRVLVKTGILR